MNAVEKKCKTGKEKHGIEEEERSDETGKNKCREGEGKIKRRVVNLMAVNS